MRTKTVFPTDDVAHIFAHQKQENARNSCSNFFFEKDTIYSYGRHFPIAKFVENNGDKVLLFTTRTYSSSTARHINIVKNACSHIRKIYCNDPCANHEDNLNFFHNKMENHLKGLHRARKKEKYISAAESVYDNLRMYCNFFGITIPTRSIDLLHSSKDGNYEEYLKREEERIKKEEEDRIRRGKIKFNQQLRNWRKGKSDRLYSRLMQHDYLRLNNQSQRIETSQGVEIPLQIAKNTFDFISNVLNKNGSCNNNCNFKIMDYDLKEVNKNFIRVGCHTIEIKEIKTMAKKLNWII